MASNSNPQKNSFLTLQGNEILEMQADRNPYLFIDKVTCLIPGKSCEGFKNLTMNEWFFPIHFEGDPCMPGFLQAEMLVQFCALTLLSLPGNRGMKVYMLSCDRMKAVRKVVPGDRIDVKTTLLSYRHSIAKGHGDGYVDGKLVITADFTFTLSISEERKSLTPKI